MVSCFACVLQCRPSVPSANRLRLPEESPYFIPQQDSWNDALDSSPNCHPGLPDHNDLTLGDLRRGSNDGSVDGYRDVIDDLTIENRKLKERLRRYEASSGSPHLDKDKLFEVKIHGLPARKKRELEETLRVFAATLDTTKDTSRMKSKAPTKIPRYHTSGDTSHNPSSLSTSNSRPIDSAYASNSNSGPTSNSASNRAGLENRFGHQRKNTKEEEMQSFLHNIPEGLLPKHSTVMTERQKKRAVVRRLEQLFTGEVSVGDHSQPLQQQEVSKSATRADRAADGLSTVEGLREANILPYEMDIDAQKPGRQGLDQDTSLSKIQTSDLVTDESIDAMTPDQRPTRPLDLDPDRAQIPSDNVDYIRHLGLSTPQFTTEESADATADADGWIYLNLLVNMAQLHIINVTPDFVRSAVADVSEKFQLSHDGQKVRWRGGTEGTRLSSDSDTNASRNRSPTDSESPDETNRKRRKIEVGKFVPATDGVRDSNANVLASQPSAFHYKPLFHHKGSSSEDASSFGESDSQYERGRRHESGCGRLGSHGSGSSSNKRKVGNDGPIVFYTGAPFCTDLSGDRSTVTAPVHVTGIGNDGYSNRTQDALGSVRKKRPSNLDRTPSGSSIPFRPFKNYSQTPTFLHTEETRPKPPELLSCGPMDLDFSPGWSSDRSDNIRPLQALTASGLGGTQPADHFTASVQTRRTILDSHTRARLSKYSAPGPASRKFLHRIPKSFLDSFQEQKNSSEDIISRLGCLHTFTPSSSPKKAEELPVKIEFMSTRYSTLEPSRLPEPSNYYAAGSSSENDSDDSSDTSGGFDLHMNKSFVRMSSPYISDYGLNAPAAHDVEQDSQTSDEDDDDDNENDDEDEVETHSNIDMLAQARNFDPVGIAAREENFEKSFSKEPCTSTDSINGESGYSTSAGSSSGSDEDNEL
jgi:hypothetical protein